MKLLLFVLIVQAVTLCVCQRPTVVPSSTTLSIASSRLIGVNTTLGIFDAELSADLYVTDASYCLPASSCEPGSSVQSCERFCNYASPSLCGTVAANDDNACENYECAHSESVCSGDASSGSVEWEELTLNSVDVVGHVIDSFQPHAYRFYVEPSADQSCRGVRVDIETHAGSARVAISRSAAVPSTEVGKFDAMIVEGAWEHTFCPGSAHHSSGTYFMLASSSSRVTSYTLSVSTFDVVADEQAAPAAVECDAATPDVPCALGEATPAIVRLGAGDALQQRLLAYTTTQCERVLVRQELLSTAGQSANGLFMMLSTSAQNPLVDEYFDDATTLHYGGARVYALCPPAGAGSSVTLSISAGTTAPVVGADGLVFSVSVTPMRLLPIDAWTEMRLDTLTMSPTTFSRIRGSVELHCDGGDAGGGEEPSTATTIVHHCRPGIDLYYATSCASFFPQLHVPGSRYLWPVPQALTAFDADKFEVLDAAAAGNVSHSVAEARRLYGVVVIELLDNTQREVLFEGGNRDTLAQRCRLSFPDMSPLSTLGGAPPAGATEQPPAAPAERCLNTEWRALSSRMASLQDAIGGSTSLSQSADAFAARYLHDVLTFSRQWLSCSTFAESFLDATQQRLQYLETARCLGDPNDPCCDERLSWTECCFTRDFNVFVDALALVNEERVSLQCGNPRCTSALLEDYAFVRIFTGQEDGCRDILPANFDVAADEALDFYRACKTAAFGVADGRPRSDGIPCAFDSECPGASGRCDALQRTCVVDRRRQEDAFLSCLAETMPVSVRTLLVPELASLAGETPPPGAIDDAELAHLLGVVAASRDCASPSAISTPLSRRFNRLAQHPDCSPCASQCADRTCPMIPACESSRRRGRENTLCHFDWVLSPSASPAECAATRRCNWSPAPLAGDVVDADATCTAPPLTPGFCGYCRAPDDCVEFDALTSRSQCESARACVLPDGTVRTDLTPAQCSAHMSCDARCPGDVECGDETTCTVEGGTCEDQEGLWALLGAHPALPATVSGVCVFDIAPFNNPDCASTPAALADYPSSRGCVRFEQCSFVDGGTRRQCSTIYRSESSCLAAGGAWQSVSDNKEDCLAKVACAERNAPGFLSSPKDGNQCRACFGETAPLSEWRAGRWLAGRPLALQWQPRAAVSLYAYDATVDYVLLERLIVAAIDASVVPQLATELACAYSPQRVLLDSIVCACHAVDDDAEEDDEFSSGSPQALGECFERSSLDIGAGVPCKGAQFFITAPPATVETLDSSFAASVPVGSCAPFTLELINARELNPDTAPPITTFAERPDDDAGRFEYVLNDNNARVGQAVGDGVIVKLSDPDSPVRLQQLRLCINQRKDIDLDLDKYPVPDFGFRVGDDKLRPYGLANIEIDEKGFVCAVVTLDQGVDSQSFMPIIRTDDFADAEQTQFSDGERALLYIVASLFTIVALAALFEIINIVRFQRGFNVKQATNLIFLFFLAYSTIRAVYFFLFASGVFDDSEDITEYVLVELPTFLYLASIIIVTLSFSFTLLREKYPSFRKPRVFWMAFFTCMLLLALFFVAIVLVFVYVVLDEDDDDSASDLCSLLVGEQKQDNSARTVRLIYQSIVATISLTIFVTLAIVGVTVWKKTSKQRYGASKMLRLVILASGSVLADSLAFIIYYAIDEPSPYFTIALIFTEVIPTLLMVLLLHTRGHSSYDSTRSGSTRSTSSS
jgi:hypothetical protein